MSSRFLSTMVLICDGCGAELMHTGSAVETRARAYGEGWRFPNKQTKYGKASERTHDVCPACQETFVPQIDTQGYHGRRVDRNES